MRYEVMKGLMQSFHHIIVLRMVATSAYSAKFKSLQVSVNSSDKNDFPYCLQQI
jgi:hypothetical protein